MFLKKRQKVVLCSFCGKSPTEGGKFVEGPGVFICDSCVAACARIIAGEPNAVFTGRFTTSVKLYEPERG
jgi:ATP-dependent Clp protease ATP-binding subunit ClpX